MEDMSMFVLSIYLKALMCCALWDTGITLYLTASFAIPQKHIFFVVFYQTESNYVIRNLLF